MPDPTPTTFFSYSRTDSEFVLRLATDLRNAGAKVWLDQLDIGAGQLWDSAIEAALRTSPRQVIVLSPEAVNSQNVMDEVSYALEEHKQVIPVLYRDCQMPFRLRRVQYIDFRTDYDHGLRDLLRTIGVAGPATVPVSPEALSSQSTTPKVGAVEKSATAASLHLDTPQREPDRPPVGGNSTGSSKKLLVYGAMALAALAIGWYLFRPTGQYDDSKVLAEITNRINGDGRVTEKNINIKFTQGMVELSGKVSSDLARNAAGDDAQVPGVKTVVNNLQIVTGLKTAGGPAAHSTPTTAPTPPPATPTPTIAKVAVPLNRKISIMNASTGMCLSPAGGNNLLNDPIVQYFCDTDPSRYWYFTAEDDGFVMIRNLSNKLCLTVAGGSTKPGLSSVQYNCDGDMSRRWHFVPIDATTFRLVNAYSKLCLTIRGGGNAKNTEAAKNIEAAQNPCDIDASSNWKIK